MQHQTETNIPILDNMDNAPFVTRQDINNFPFPYKLWLVVHLDFCDFLRWNRDGTVVLLDLVALEDYLNSSRSIFKIKNRSIFLEHLEQFKFERLNATPEAEEDLLLQYKNENFQRHRLDLLAKIRRRSEAGSSSTHALQSELALEAHAQKQAPVVERMLGDLCFMSHGALSNIQKSRLRFQTILNFQNETRILQEKLKASDEHAAAQLHQRRFKSDGALRTVNAAALNIEEEQVIELPVELFENPHDSVLHLQEDFRPEYAGYYGNCSKNQILHFFGDYLPMYEDGSMEVRKVVAEMASSNNYNASETEQRVEFEISNIHEDAPKLDSFVTAVEPQNSMSTLSISSTLEPIFKNDDEDDTNQVCSTSGVNNGIELEISMDEFIKFKDNNDHTIKGEPSSISEDITQMPSAIKLEITDEEDSENEANFRNFFSQYRASLNLLYERH